jgi:O-antigen/teichoic acid export membrane protein
LFPVLSRSDDGGDFHRYRRLLLAGALLPLAVFLVAGPWLIEFLYDDRYRSAGGLLQILSLGAAAAVLRVLSEPFLLARGDSRARMILSLCEAILLLAGLAVGGVFFGLPGFLAGYVAAQFLTLIPAAVLLRKAGVAPTCDSAAFLGAMAFFAALGWFLHGTPSAAL